ncbi:peripheral-type benzodiazepine receptor-associated protein 1 [Tiliqua scincoides]|uniref:peripheral-type benzodiazepine receptor-associated protein 1 n=1 Tax=Tiliqua scincoides TaxID=71010 RepID=UPI0034629044
MTSYAFQYNVSYQCLLRQNQVLLTALEELQSRCAGLKKENSLLRKSCFPETQEKVRHLKRKNAELAVIAKRLEERARKLQEANLKVVNAPVAVKGSCAGLCKKALARQRATDLQEQASVLLEKDKQISSLQQECHELQAKVMAGKEGPPCLPLMDFRHLLRESQKEVLRLQRQIALKNFKASLGGQGPAGAASASTSLGSPVPTRPTYSNGLPPSRAPRQQEELSSTREATSQLRARSLFPAELRDPQSGAGRGRGAFSRPGDEAPLGRAGGPGRSQALQRRGRARPTSPVPPPARQSAPELSLVLKRRRRRPAGRGQAGRQARARAGPLAAVPPAGPCPGARPPVSFPTARKGRTFPPAQPRPPTACTQPPAGEGGMPAVQQRRACGLGGKTSAGAEPALRVDETRASPCCGHFGLKGPPAGGERGQWRAGWSSFVRSDRKGASPSRIPGKALRLSKTGPQAPPLVHSRDEDTALPAKKAEAVTPEIKQQIQQLESELRKKRKQCENLEHEVRKKHKRYTELEIQLQEIQSDHDRLLEENTLLQGQVAWTEKVESENTDLRLQVAVVTKERDSALQKSQELQTRLESLGQALKHMKDVAGRRQQLELEHEKALQALQKKQDEVRQLQKAQAEARKEHEGAVQLLEAHVQELEDQCRSHTEQFRFLEQELQWFRLQAGKRGPPLPSSLGTSEATVTPCQPSLQLLDVPKEKGSAIVPVSPWLSGKDGGGEGLPPATPGLLDPAVPAMDIGLETSTPPLACKKALRRLESQSSSSRSESLHNSPKCCPTPEVDTASEMEELDADSFSLIPEPESQSPVKLRVFLARYSYNPFDGPNENPEAELPLTAGEYIYIYGEMDDDGFFEGELMDGRRGLVPSNFVERVSDDDLVTFLPQELLELSQSSPLERSFLSSSPSSAERSDYSAEELSTSTAPSRVGGDQEAAGDPTAVPYPRKVALLKQFGSSVLVGWEPPLLPTGHSEVQSYNVYVETELRQTVKAGSPTKAVIEKLDLKAKAYRISVQAVLERGSSDRLRCTFLVGHEAALAPTQLRVHSITATSAGISWLPSNSNFPHTLYLNREARDTTKAGVYWYTFCNLSPNTSYVATVEAQPSQAVWDPSQDRREQALLLAETHFLTASAGSPDAPLDVRVEHGPSAGILVISWLPVTIDAEGSSNGVRVTGYAVYADGQKVMEVTSPTAGSVLVEVSQLQILQVCQEVSVRTVSLYGESVDSVPAQVPPAFLGDAGHSSSTGPSCGEERGSALSSAPDKAVAKITSENSPKTLPEEASPSGCSSPTRALLTDPPQALPPPELGTVTREERESFVPPPGCPATTYLDTTRTAALEESKEDPQEPLQAAKEPELESAGSRAGKPKTCEASSAEPGLEGLQPEGGGHSDQVCLGAKTPDFGPLAVQGNSGRSEKGAPGPLAGTSGRKLLKETSRDDSAIPVPRVRREGEKRSDPGNRPLTLLADHSRGSDLSDIMEEEEEEEEDEEGDSQHSGRQGDSKWNPREYHSRENGEKQDAGGDSDSDEELLERILEAPLQRPCGQALFSIPEEAEEEEEEEEGWARRRAEARPRRRPRPRGRSRGAAPAGSWPGKEACGGLYRAHSLQEDLDVISSLGEALLEIDVEYDSEPGWTSPSASASSSDGEEEASGSGAARALRRCSSWEDEGAERSASPGRARSRSGEERSRSLERSPALCSAPRGGTPPPAPAPAPAWVREPCRVCAAAAAAAGLAWLGCARLRPGLLQDSSSPPPPQGDLRGALATGRIGTPPPRLLPARAPPAGLPGIPVSLLVGEAGPPPLHKHSQPTCSAWAPHMRLIISVGEPLRKTLRLTLSLFLLQVAGSRDPQLLDWQAPGRRGRQSLRSSPEVAAARANSGPWGSPPSQSVDDGDSVRLFVALFDYDPVSMSPNPDAAEEELPFQEGQILKVYGHKDADGFYRGECAGRTGFIPCNMVSEVQVDSSCARQQLLQDGHIPPEMLAESLGNGAFSPPPQRPTAHPPKPQRSKKGECEGQDLSSEEDVPRTVLAIFDYSPTLNPEVELKLGAGDIMTVLRSRESDAFYYGEANGQKGLAPSDFLEAVPLDGAPPGEPSLGRQKMRERRVQ